MVSKIRAKQNSPEAIDLLRAVRAAYGREKTLGWVQFGLPSVAAGAAFLAPHVLPSAVGYVALASTTIPLIDYLFLEPAGTESHANGAKLQEEFDAYVMSFPWKTRQKVDPEVRHQLAQRWPKDDPSLRDWYPPEVDRLPLEQARLLCQRSNMQWDAGLRRSVWQGFMAALVVTIVVAIIWAMCRRLSVEAAVVEVVAPVAPLCLRLARKLNAHRTAASKSENAKHDVVRLWSRTLEGSLEAKPLEDETRATQEDLFDRRLRSPQVPDCVHKFMRSDFEAQMKAAAAAMVKEALQANAKRSVDPASVSVGTTEQGQQVTLQARNTTSPETKG